MARRYRIAIAVGCVLVTWLVVLVVLGSIYGGTKAQAIADRIGESLKATGTTGDHDLALVRGRLSIDHLQAQRDDAVGKLSLDVGEVRCELAPLGLALVDSSCRELAISEIQLELSSFALFKIDKPKRTPIHAGSVVIHHAVMAFPDNIRLVIERAEAGPTTFKTPLSWVFELETLDATLEMPLGSMKIAYANGLLNVSGGLFGAQPIVLPLNLPVADLAEDPAAEIARLVALGRQLAKLVIEQKTAQWLRTLPGK